MTAAPGSTRRRRWSFVVTALLLGLVCSAGLVELVFRLAWTPPLPEFQQAGMYVATADGDIALQPGYRGTLDITLGAGSGKRVTAVAVNGIGLRGDDLPPKAAGERRLLVLGDSMVFGYGVEVGEALPARLQSALAEAGPQVTVGNGGIPGYGTKHAVAHMARLEGSFGADAFVLCGCLGNDALDDLGQARTVYGGLQFSGAMARLLQSSLRMRLAIRSRAALWLETWIYTHHPTASPLLQLAPTDDELLATRGVPGDPPVHGKAFAGLFLDVVDDQRRWDPGAPPIVPRVLENLRAAMARAKEIAGDRPLVYVLLPTCYQVVEPMRAEKLRELGFAVGEFRRGLAQQRWLDAVRSLGIRAYDATPILASAPVDAQPTLFVEDACHLSLAGNERLAQWLAAELAPLLK
jgi:lysophospholipase L1-like esterase